MPTLVRAAALSFIAYEIPPQRAQGFFPTVTGI